MPAQCLSTPDVEDTVNSLTFAVPLAIQGRIPATLPIAETPVAERLHPFARGEIESPSRHQGEQNPPAFRMIKTDFTHCAAQTRCSGAWLWEYMVKSALTLAERASFPVLESPGRHALFRQEKNHNH